MNRGKLAAVPLLILVGACGDDADRPSAEQNQDMNEAAEMLNEAPADLSNVDDGELNQNRD